MTDPTNPAPPVEELRESTRLGAFIVFMLGAGPLDGRWFGESPPEGSGNFWWRKDFHALLDHLSSLTVENERLRRIAYGPLRSAQHALDIIGGSPWASEGHSELAREESARIETAIQSLSSLPAMKGEG